MAFKQLNNISMDEDDDDLESLRLAALQSIHKKVAAPFDVGLSKPKECLQQKIYSPTNRRGRGGFHQNNRGRNGLFNNQRSRNANLISIPTEVESPIQKIDPPKAKSKFAKDTDNSFKLMLPQDRYCNISVEKEVKEQPSSKFSRYDNSDDSESESEDEESDGSDAESTGVLKKAGSLEALMQELENEIQGKSNDPKIDTDVTKAPKIKRRNKRLRTRTISGTIEKDTLQDNLDTEPINSPEHHDIPSNDGENATEKNDDKTDKNKELSPDKIQTLKQFPDVPKESQNIFNRKPSPPQIMRNRSPPPHLLPRKQPTSPPYIMHRKRSPKRQHPSHNNTINNYNSNSFHTYPSQFRPQQITPFAPPYNIAPFPPFGPPPLDIIRQQPPPFLLRPLSPLAINTEALCTITKAPLSPRSAAFVLQNREIIAQRRRKSPKRSPTFSRSPSPRRSLSPLLRRSPRSLSKSPNRNRGRSRSPLPPRRLTSPRGGRNNSPPRRRRSMSPESVRRNAQFNRKPLRERRASPLPPKQSVRDRLGVRGKEVVKVEKSSQNSKEAEARADRVMEDPILEARKRKFERKEISIKDGGVIKLKKDEEQQEELPTSTIELAAVNPKTEDEDLLLDEVLDSKVDDIFSDDEDDENDGLFKTFDKVEVTSEISISKELNGSRDIKIEPLIKECSTYKRNTRDQPERLDRERKKRRRTLSPVSKEVELEQGGSVKAADSALSKQRIVRSTKAKQVLPPRVTSPIESKKIEIKIRNPAKYEEASHSKYDVATEDEMRRTDETKRGKKERGVDMLTDEMGVIVEDDGDTVAADVVDDMNEGQIVESKSADGGDLRTQLSRKRAERQNNHHSVVEAIQSRLLQTALQDAVFTKVKKSKRSKHREGTLKELDNALLQQRVYCDNFYCKLTRLRLIEKEQELKQNERVCVLCPEENIPNSQDGKLPIHLRLGLGGSDVQIYTEHRKKSKKSKHRSLDQV